MKLRLLSAAVALAVSTVTWAANGTAPQAAAQPIPQTPEAWL